MTPSRLTASEAAAAIAAGTLSSEDLVRDCLRRIGERESEIRAWAFIDTAGAIAAARNADTAKLLGAGPFGPLHGVPIGVKDIIDTADMPTQHNSVIYRGNRPGSDAAVVMLLQAAGAVANISGAPPWVVRHSAVANLMRDKRLRGIGMDLARMGGIPEDSRAWRWTERQLLFMDGADHHRLRRLLATRSVRESRIGSRRRSASWEWQRSHYCSASAAPVRSGRPRSVIDR